MSAETLAEALVSDNTCIRLNIIGSDGVVVGGQRTFQTAILRWMLEFR